MQLSITEEKINQLEKSVLTLLYFVKDNKIQRYNRLQLALYHMRESFLPAFDFKSNNKWGKADENIRNFLNLLCGEIDSEVKREGDTPYLIYHLTVNGLSHAEQLVSELTEDELLVLKHISNCINVHSEEISLKPLISCLEK
ncbi:MAG: hypothetical protein ACE5RC_03825 [Nitrosopumilus sp.]